jgi:hypothetical protein
MYGIGRHTLSFICCCWPGAAGEVVLLHLLGDDEHVIEAGDHIIEGVDNGSCGADGHLRDPLRIGVIDRKLALPSQPEVAECGFGGNLPLPPRARF